MQQPPSRTFFTIKQTDKTTKGYHLSFIEKKLVFGTKLNMIISIFYLPVVFYFHYSLQINTCLVDGHRGSEKRDTMLI